MARLVGLVLLLLLGLVAAGYASVRALLSWRQERRKRRVMLDAQREADLREQAGRRDARRWAADAIEDAAYRDEPASVVAWNQWVERTCDPTTGGYVQTTTTSLTERSHPLGWTVVGLPGGVLCGVGPACFCGCGERSVDRYDADACAWQVVLPPDGPLHAEAVAALS